MWLAGNLTFLIKTIMKNLILIASVFFLFSKTAQARNLYVGGGFQLNNISFQDSEPQGTIITTETIEVIDDDLTTIDIVDNGDGTTTTTTVTTADLVDVEHKRVGAYLDSGDFFAKSFNSFNVFTGINFNDRMALEFGLFYQQKDKANNNSNEFIYDGKTTQSSSTLAIISADMVLSRLLIEEIANLNLIIGGSMVSFKTKMDFFDNGVYSNSESKNHTDFGFNIGVGVETKINKRLWLRTSIKGIILPGSDFMKTIMTANVGLKVVLF